VDMHVMGDVMAPHIPPQSPQTALQQQVARDLWAPLVDRSPWPPPGQRWVPLGHPHLDCPHCPDGHPRQLHQHRGQSPLHW
jgi:hypothetical protein